jgi:hypothetical protein
MKSWKIRKVDVLQHCDEDSVRQVKEIVLSNFYQMLETFTNKVRISVHCCHTILNKVLKIIMSYQKCVCRSSIIT